MSTAAVTHNIQGLPPGATLKPIQGLPPGAELRPIQRTVTDPNEKQNFDNAPQGNSGFFGPIQDAYDDAESAPAAHMGSPAGVHGLGVPMLGAMARGVGDLLYPVMHPLNTVEALPKAMVGPHGFGMADTILSGLAHDVHENPGEALPRFLGQMAGGELASGVGEAARAVGAPMERVGTAAVNDALGARGPKPFQWGHNPARGAETEGVVPALSKHSASMKLAPVAEGGSGVMDDVGGRISTAIAKSPNSVPLDFIRRSIEEPLDTASAVERGPGVGGVTTDQISTVRGKMMAKAPTASAPIYGPNAGTRFTPQETVEAMAKPLRALPAPMEDVPLSNPQRVEGTPSRPISLHQVDLPMRAGLPTPSENIPMSSHVDQFPNQLPSATSSVRTPFDGGEASGMGPGEYIGQVPGERGGVAPSPGVLRRPMQFNGPEQPSPFMNMRHDTATPSDLWATIRNVDEKTRFNKAIPEVEGLNELQQNIRGSLAKNLKEAVPDVAPHMQTYGDLAGARDALDRTMHSGQSLAKVLDAAKFPLETTGGVGLMRTGRALQKIDPRYLRTMAVPGMMKEN